jgi:hypothetical protein
MSAYIYIILIVRSYIRMLQKILYIVLLSVIILICAGCATYSSTNAARHRNSSSLYAHFSKIDAYNYFIFPRLLFAHPQKFILTPGQSIYMPKKWWHWVTATTKTFAINYWFNNKIHIDRPFVITAPINTDIHIPSLHNETVTVWNSLTDEAAEHNFKQFYNSKQDNRYIITLDNYDMGANNANIKAILAPFVTFPKDARIETDPGDYDYNIWISSGKHTTGLHYDDEDGLLTVVEGAKEIIMFPPSDTKYLYAYDTTYKWASTTPQLFKYNSYTYIGKCGGISSGMLLYTTCNNNARVLANISKLYEKHGERQLVWGFKKNKDVYRWELYLYTLDKYIAITSWDIHPLAYNISDEEHYYYKYADNNLVAALPFWGYGKYKKHIKDTTLHDESKIFVIDTYRSFYANYDAYMHRLGFETIKDTFRDIILHKYSCYEICIFNKHEHQIFVMYMGLTNADFVEFLTSCAYPPYIVDYVKRKMSLNEYEITNEIAIVYDTTTLEVIRSGFYGIT